MLIKILRTGVEKHCDRDLADTLIQAGLAEEVIRAGTPKEQKTWKQWDKAYHTLCWDPVTPGLIDYLAEWTTKQRK